MACRSKVFPPGVCITLLLSHCQPWNEMARTRTSPQPAGGGHHNLHPVPASQALLVSYIVLVALYLVTAVWVLLEALAALPRWKLQPVSGGDREVCQGCDQGDCR